jgi:hypothetical protein
MTHLTTTPLNALPTGRGISPFNWLVAESSPEYHLVFEQFDGKDGEGLGGRRLENPLVSGQAEAVGIACLTIKGLSSAADWRLPRGFGSPARLPSLFEARVSISWSGLFLTRLCNPILGVFVARSMVYYLRAEAWASRQGLLSVSLCAKRLRGASPL